MRRITLLGIITPMLMLVGMSNAQVAGVQANVSSDTPSLMQQVDVVHAPDGIRVEIRASGTLSPTATAVVNPDRLVIDLPNVVVGRLRTIAVGSDGIKSVRVAQNSANPPRARIVVDLSGPRDYQLLPDGNHLTLKLTNLSNVADHVSASPVTAKLVPVKATISSGASSGPKAAAVSAQGKDSKPKDFVFVEPTFEAKPASPSPQGALTTGAAMAAKRPDSLLLPPESASMRSSAQNSAQSSTQNAGQPESGSQSAASPSDASTQSSPKSSAVTIKPAVNMAAEQQMTQGPTNVKTRYTGEPISVNLKDVDLKDFFRLIHEISGLNIVLDPNVKGSLTIVLDDVPWDQALDIVLKNNGLDRQLEGNVLRIATIDTMRKEAEARRGQIEAEALAVDKITVTRFLSYAHSKDVVPTLKKLLSSRGDIISDDRTNALIIQDIPTVIPELDRLIAQLDRKTQEVEIEARVVAATRTFARDIGTQFGFGWGNGPTAFGGASSVGNSPNTSAPPPGSQFFTVAGSNAIPLFSNMPVPSPNGGISFTNGSSNYRIDAILTLAESRGLLKILSRPRVVTQNNIQAIVRQGFRVPVVTQAQLGGPPTVTYVDAFLRLTVTPQITAESTIFLNVDVENTTPDFSRQVQGNPTLLTQQATTQVLVTDGGTVVIGGVIQTQNSINVQQVPLLGNIPALGNLFKRRTVSTSTQELIFFITPKIIQT